MFRVALILLLTRVQSTLIRNIHLKVSLILIPFHPRSKLISKALMLSSRFENVAESVDQKAVFVVAGSQSSTV
jgi:hypothetical protein